MICQHSGANCLHNEFHGCKSQDGGHDTAPSQDRSHGLADDRTEGATGGHYVARSDPEAADCYGTATWDDAY